MVIDVHGHYTAAPAALGAWRDLQIAALKDPMIHVSTSCNSCFHTTGSHYLNADTTAFMQCLQGDLFKDFPTLKFLIPHGGGAGTYSAPSPRTKR